MSALCGNGARPRPFAEVPVRGPRSIGSLAKPGAAQHFLICSIAFVQPSLSYYTKSCSLDWFWCRTRVRPVSLSRLAEQEATTRGSAHAEGRMTGRPAETRRAAPGDPAEERLHSYQQGNRTRAALLCSTSCQLDRAWDSYSPIDDAACPRCSGSSSISSGNTGTDIPVSQCTRMSTRPRLSSS